tara:strand:- start:7451 stop:8239 length:789 start_codon:yes stop_codon:yes gene_type:complete
MDIQQQKSYKVLLVGDSCEDVYHYGVCERLSPEAPIPVLRETHTEVRAGMSTNVKLNLQSFNIDVVHITNPQNIIKHRYVDTRYNHHLLRCDENDFIDTPLSAASIPMGYRYDAVVISDYNKGFLTQTVCSHLTRHFTKLHVPVFVDTKKKNLTCFENCIIKINDKEHKSITHYPLNADFVITLGDRGVLYKGTIYPTKATEVFDVCGAGDVFLASLICGYLHTRDMKHSLELANKLAGISVSHMGTYVLTKEDIEKHDICI